MESGERYILTVLLIATVAFGIAITEPLLAVKDMAKQEIALMRSVAINSRGPLVPRVDVHLLQLSLVSSLKVSTVPVHQDVLDL